MSEAFVCTPVPGPFDDATRRYIEAAQPAFEDLRDVASQLAGLMVLAASGASTATIDHPMVAVATERWRAARDETRALRPSPQAAHHHRHLVRAAERIGEVLAALREAGTFKSRIATPLPLLRGAWQEILHTANALPGFRTLDLEQACCAAHAKRRRILIDG